MINLIQLKTLAEGLGRNSILMDSEIVLALINEIQLLRADLSAALEDFSPIIEDQRKRLDYETWVMAADNKINKALASSRERVGE